MRLVSLLLLMITTLPPSARAASLAGVWRLVEINSLPMQETPPYGQLNRKEVYTAGGELLTVRPDAPFSEARLMGRYEVHENVRVFTSPEGEQVATPIQWIDDDHYFFEFTPGERWYYARVTGTNAQEQQWEPRSVAVIRTSEDGEGPTLRNFPYDATDDSTMPWNKRVVGAWETIRVGGRGVSGPDTPPYGMPNDRFLIGADGRLRKVHANGESDPQEEAVRFKIESNQLILVDAGLVIHFWFNRWGQLVFEQAGTQTVFKRISLDPTQAPAGPFVVVLLASDREEPTLTNGRIVEVKKSAFALVSAPFPEQSSGAHNSALSASRPASRPKRTFTQPFNGRSFPSDLALADTDDALKPENAVCEKARKDGLGSTSNILETNESEKFSVIRADAIDCNFEVPFGWHVADNGDRMLVFDPDHFIEISLEQQTVNAGVKVMLQGLLEAQRVVQPDIKSQLMENSGNSFLLILQNVKEGEDIKTRSYLTHDIGQGSKILVAQITAGPADMVRALNLSEALMRHLKYQP